MKYLVHTKRYIKKTAYDTFLIEADSEEEAYEKVEGIDTEDFKYATEIHTGDSDTVVRGIPELK